MKNVKITVVSLFLIIAILIACVPMVLGTAQPERRLGCWWWYKEDGNNAETRQMYLDFLEQGNVNEIYYYNYTALANGEFEEIHTFVEDAMAHGMRVAILFDDPDAAKDPDHTYMLRLKDGYLAYKEQYPNDALYGLHFDIEPGFTQEILQAYADNFITKVQDFRKAGIICEIDVACGWGTPGAEVTLDGVTGIYNIIAQNCDTMALMSYRDTAEGILAFGEKAYNACVANGCDVLFCAETGDYGEGDYVEFSGETKEYMYGELEKVYAELDSRNLDIDYGMAIHQHRTFYNMEGDLPSKDLKINKAEALVDGNNVTVNISASGGSGDYTYFYYLLGNGKVIDSEIYSDNSQATLSAESFDGCFLRVYVQDSQRKRVGYTVEL